MNRISLSHFHSFLRYAFLICSLLLLFSGCSSIPFLSKSPSQQFENFLDDYFQRKYAIKGTAPGPFPSLWSGADSLRGVSAARVLNELHKIDATQLSADERIDWIQMEAQLKREVKDRSLKSPARVPNQYLTLGDIYWQITRRRPPTAEEWLGVLKSIGDATYAMQLGRRQLKEPPPLWIQLAANTARRYEEFLGEPFVTRVKTAAPDSLQDRLLRAAERTRKALAGFQSFLSDTLVPGPENSWAVGQEYYDWLLKEYHFLPYTSEQMIALGWEQHKATKAALQELAKRIDPNKTLRQVIDDLKSRHPKPGAIMEAYHRESDRVRALLVSHQLVTIPKPETLIFVPTPPALRETYAWGGYGGIDNRSGVPTGRFFVTDVVPEMTPDQVDEKLRAQNDGWITVIALHEGYPGHHLQNLYAMKSPRKVRSRFGSTYYGEGWALYAESWMAREDFYQNADDSLAWLQMRLWRTARVIIDPSIHTGKMTYEQAVQFFVDEVGLERSAAEAEVNRFTTWPTQAPSYIIGWLEIEKLEKELRDRLGPRFDHRKFVETVLSVGSLPLELMKRAVRARYEPPERLTLHVEPSGPSLKAR